jgi:hypothetical protein
MARSVRWLPLLLLLPSHVSFAAPPRAGGEFLVNSYTTYNQTGPAVGVGADGRFVVVWESYLQDGDRGGIFGQRHDAAGNPVGGEFQVSQYWTGQQDSPAVAVAPSGAFFVVWRGAPGQDGSYEGVFGRRYAASGAPLGAEFRVNAYTTGNQFHGRVAADGAENFLVVWRGNGAPFGIKARRYDAGGIAGSELTLSETPIGSPSEPGLAMNADGSFVAVWAALNDGGGSGVVGRRFDSTGVGLAPAFALNTYTTGDQRRPRVALTGDGTFTVVWHSYGQDGAGNGVFGRRFDSTGPVSPEFPVNTFTTNTQQSPEIAADGAGGFLVAWERWGWPASPASDAVARSYDASGTALDPEEFLVNTYWTSNQRPGGIASDAAGRFVVVWQSHSSGGPSSYNISAQRFGDLIFRDDFESFGLSAWSATAGGGDVGLSAAAAMGGTTVGMQTVVNDTAGVYVQDNSPADESRYRARFYLDPNGFDPGEAQNRFRTRTLIAFTEAPTRRVAAVVLRRIGGVYTVMARARRDDNSQANTGFFAFANAPQTIEIELVRATDPDADDGALELWIDGTSMIRLTGLDNSLAEVDFARLGALSVKPGASGTLYFDQFHSRRQSYIGLLP